MDKNTDALLLHMLKGDFVKGFVWRQFGADVFFVRRLRLAHFLLYDNAAGLKRMKGKSKMFCTKCGAKLSDKAKFCTSCGEPVNNQTPEKQNKNSKLIWAAIVVVVILFIIIAACDDTGDVAGDNTTDNTLQSEEIIVTDTPTSPEPDTELTPTETTVESDESKYPKTYNDKGELIVYWLEGGSVWHESAKCGTVINAEASKLHSGTPYEAYSNGKERACKTCSSDSTVVITETTRTPDTTSVPETTHTPEITIVPEITEIPETTVVPDISTLPETTVTPETTEVPETTKTPAPEEPEAGDKVSMEELTAFLTKAGYIEDGGDLSDPDFEFLAHLIGLLDLWCKSR
jgi:predicted nucleic acid-binding Zn ribbon protein